MHDAISQRSIEESILDVWKNRLWKKADDAPCMVRTLVSCVRVDVIE